MLRRLPKVAGTFAAVFLLATNLLNFCLPADIIAAEPAAPAGKNEIKAVLDAWQKRFELSRSWKCEVDASLVIPKGQHLSPDDEELSPELLKILKVKGPFPFKETVCPLPFVLFVDRKAARRRLERTDCILDTDSLTYKPDVRISAYDGTIVWSHNPRKKDAGGIDEVDLYDQNQCEVDYRHLPIYFAHGLFPHETNRIDWDHPELSTAGHLKLIIDGTKIIGATHCLRIRNPTAESNRKYNMYLDPQRDYAVMRWESVTLDGVHCAIEVTEYRQQDGLHLPIQWQTVHFGGGVRSESPARDSDPTPTEKFIVKVKRYETNPQLDKSLFNIPGDGKVVLRDQRPKKKN